jgi:glycosyltransferase involved in cell wall biosynthesis
MTISIITPSYRQLDWLRLCVASVRDQAVSNAESGNLKPETKNSPSHSADFSISVEHIIQDAGTPSIEEFAREIGADLYRDGKLVFSFSASQEFSFSSYRIAIYCERDAGMYDAINRGLRRSAGEACAWLNCDEQYLPGALECVAQAFTANPRWQVVLGDTILLNENLEPRSYRIGLTPSRDYIRQFQLNMHSSSLFFRRELLDQGYWLGDRFRSIGDAEWVVRMLDGRVRIRRFSHLLSTFILGRANLSAAQISLDEKAVWRKERPLAKWKSWLVRSVYILRRGLSGGFLPRRKGIAIFTPSDLKVRQQIPPRWLDFRFRT